jgi:hypothetical protein
MVQIWNQKDNRPFLVDTHLYLFEQSAFKGNQSGTRKRIYRHFCM